jgi:hypothetical protein
MKRSDPKKIARRKSQSGNEATIVVRKPRTLSKERKGIKPARRRSSRLERLPMKPGSVDLQHLSIMFSTPESIRSYIYECASKVCEGRIRSRITNETLVYKRLARELPLFISLSGASELVDHLCASKDPVEAFVHFKASLQLEMLRRSTAKIATKRKRQNKVTRRASSKNGTALLTHSSALKTPKFLH